MGYMKSIGGSYWEGGEEIKYQYQDAEGTVVNILGLKQNNLKYQNNLKSLIPE